MNEHELIILCWSVVFFAGLCVLLFWSRIASFIAERRERRKAREWELRSKS